jgi:hypothetical protein
MERLPPPSAGQGKQTGYVRKRKAGPSLSWLYESRKAEVSKVLKDLGKKNVNRTPSQSHGSVREELQTPVVERKIRKHSE